MRWLSGVAVLLVAVGVLGCGGGGASTTESESAGDSTSASRDTGKEPPFAGCGSSKQSYQWGKEMIAEGEQSIEAGKEIKAAEASVRIGEKMVRQAISGCAVEAELKASEAKICSNSPRELAEAIELEDTRGNEEYIGVYEATCGKHVPTR